MKLASDKHKPKNDAWLSLVERCVRDAEAAGSNPVASIRKTDTFRYPFFRIGMTGLISGLWRSERFGRRGPCPSSGRALRADRSGAENAGSNPVASIQKTDTSRYPFFLYVFSVRRFVSGFAFLSDRLKRGDRQIDGQNNQHNCDNRLYDIPRILSCHFDLRDDRQDQ